MSNEMSANAHSSSTHRGRGRRRRAAATILMVDDYADNRSMMKKLLEMSGYQVLEAENGVDAVKLTQENHPGLVIMDLGLPLLNGMEAAKLIRQIPEVKAVPIIALSAYDDAEIREEAIASGCDEYLTKPVDYAKLEVTIQDLLKVKQTN